MFAIQPIVMKSNLVIGSTIAYPSFSGTDQSNALALNEPLRDAKVSYSFSSKGTFRHHLGACVKIALQK